MTAYTAVILIVVRAAIQQAAENAAVAADPESGAGAFIPGVPLRQAGDVSNTVVAYWTGWNMQPGQQSAFAQALGGPVAIHAPGDRVNTKRDRWLFDASEGGWTPQQVLDALGFDRLG